jgi:S-formylglutathione hydrolase FrmB
MEIAGNTVSASEARMQAGRWSHGPYTGVSGLFIFPGDPRNKNRDAAHNPENQDLAANSLCMLATTKGIRCAAVAQPGRHDWPYAATEFAAALPWLAGQLDSPAAPHIPLPVPSPAPSSPPVWAQAAGR